MPDLPAIRDFALDHMKRVYDGLTEGLIGIGISDRKEWILSIGYLLQRQRGKDFLDSLMCEWEKYRKKGKIKEDYATTEQCQASLQEILDCLDRDSPDGVKFSFMKKLFISIGTEQLSDRESVLPQQYIRIARSLSSGEILLLSAGFKVAKSDRTIVGQDFSVWMAKVLEYSGLGHPELIQLYEQDLTSKKLLLLSSGTMHTGQHHRLTSLGYEICRFVEHYEEDMADLRKEG